MPPCMQISVAPAARLVDPIADLLHRQRVGVGVGAPLGERAEPAAGVADVGEVDVPVHDVGDVVAVDVGADGVGQRPTGSRGRCRRRPAAPGTRRRTAPPGPARRAAAAPAPRGRRPSARWSARPARRSCARAAPTSRRRPRRSRCAGPSSARPCPPRRAGRPGRTTSTPRPAPATAARRGSGPRRPARRAGQRGHVRAHPRRGSGWSTYGGWAASRSRSSKRPRRDAPSLSMFGHGRSGLTWSGVSGETPPQSSTPARSSSPSSVESDRFGGACTRAFRPSSSQLTATAATYSCSSRSSWACIAVRGLAGSSGR